MTQRDRVLRLLKQRAGEGITQADFDGPTADGGPPVRRLAARVEELRKAGHVITSSKDSSKFARYSLVKRVDGQPHVHVASSPASRAGLRPDRQRASEGLFQVEPEPSLGPYEEEWV